MTLSTSSRETRPGFRVWGLTGGIASGKSTAARYFREAGLPVIDADEIARKLSAPDGAAYHPIQLRFGTADRAQLRELVFRDEKARRDLESIIHPLIRAESYRQMQELAKGHQGTSRSLVILYEAALLIETGRHRDFEGLIVIDAPREIRKKRLMERDRIPDELAEQIFSSQVSDEARRKAATLVIDNTGSLEKLRKEVLEIASKLPEALS